MPTWHTTTRFSRDYARLGEEEKALFRAAVREFIEDLKKNTGRFRSSLRVKHVQGTVGVFEMTWEYHDGRATFEFGKSPLEGEAHVVWRRIGSHSIFGTP